MIVQQETVQPAPSQMEGKSTFQVTINDTGELYSCGGHETLLQGMAKLGKRGIPIGCRGGGCGVCKVEVTEGEYLKKAMSRAHVSPHDEECGRVLACRVYPRSDVKVRVLGKMVSAVTRQQAK